MCTYNDGTTICLAVDTLVAQVEDQSSGAVQEAKHTDTDKELSRGGVVTLEVDGYFTAVT